MSAWWALLPLGALAVATIVVGRADGRERLRMLLDEARDDDGSES